MSAELSNRFDFAEAQPRIYASWEQRGLFAAQSRPDRPPFAIVIPPPNVTGALHLGHALNNTLQDVLVRMKRMQGFNTLWMPGTDHAGIATQAVVERRLKEEEGLTRHDLGREALEARIWKWKDQYETRILGQLKQMGCSCDWHRTRFTLDNICARAVRETFFTFFQEGLIYRGKRLVNWDTFLQTAVSDDEVESKTVQGSFWHLRYPVIDPRPGEPEFVTIATTRPETMLGDTAVAVHPDPAAELEKQESERAARLARAAAKERPALEAELENIRRRRRESLAALEQLRDMALDQRRLRLPLLDREIPLVADRWAKPELGSGCVKITPAHDPNDYEVGRRCELPMINIFNSDGTLNEDAGPYQGLTIKAARRRVVEDLESRGLVAEVEDREIELPHSDRSKTPIEPLLADQWFVKMDQLAQSAIDAVEDGRVEILPSRYAKGYRDWLAEKRDWPVSRQLWWGHRIPVWSAACETPEQLEQLRAQIEPLQAAASREMAVQIETPERVFDSSRVKLPAGTIHVCLRMENEALERQLAEIGLVRDPDVLDTWFSSALWPHSTLGWPERTPDLAMFYPTATLITSRDIITLWVARMVLAGLHNMGDVPFRNVFIHPKILDGDGETMSKSKGNGIDPIDVIDKFGADALRFGMTYLTTDTQDVRMPVEFECPHCSKLIKQTVKNRVLPRIECPHCGDAFSTQWAEQEADRALPRGAVVSERFEQGRNFGNKLWNAARFSLMNLEGYQAGPVAAATLSVEDRWMLSRLTSVTEEVTAALESFRYADAARSLYGFAWDEFCSFYIEIAKARLDDPPQRALAQRVLAGTLDALLRLLHPIMPFLTEEIWQKLNAAAPQRGLEQPAAASETIMEAEWPKADSRWVDQAIEARFALFQQTLGAVREIRSQQNIPPKAVVEFRLRCSPETADLLAPMRAYFTQLANATLVELGPETQCGKLNATGSLPSIEVFVDLRGHIDVDAEVQRLEKGIGKQEKLIVGKRNKLSNERFVSNAPAAVVQQEREALAQLEEQLAALQTALRELTAGE